MPKLLVLASWPEFQTKNVSATFFLQAIFMHNINVAFILPLCCAFLTQSKSKREHLGGVDEVVTDMTATDSLVNSLSGGLAGSLTEIIFYTIDSFKIQQQTGDKISLHRLYRGAVPIALCGAFPSLAVFFGAFTPLKDYVNTDQRGDTTHNGAGIFIASIMAAIPSSLAGIPADVLKKRLVLGIQILVLL